MNKIIRGLKDMLRYLHCDHDWDEGQHFTNGYEWHFCKLCGVREGRKARSDQWERM